MPDLQDLLDASHELVDRVKLHELHWFYEHRGLYRHSFLVLKADLSSFELERMEILGIPDS